MSRYLTFLTALALTAPATAQTAGSPPADGAYGTFGATAVRDLVGLDVRESSGLEIGEVDALVRAGDAVQAIVGVGGFLGFGEHDVAIPISQFVMKDGDLMLPDLSEAELRGMTGYDGTLEELPEDVIVAGDPLPEAGEPVAPSD